MSDPAPAVAAPAPTSSTERRDPGLVAFATALRVAGFVIAAGFLSGVVPGTIVVAALALGLLTVGRGAAPEAVHQTLGAAAIGVVLLAVTVGALRWGSVSLDAMRGAQAVLGPTLLIEPQEAAVGGSLAAGGGVLALSLWLSALRPRDVLGFVLASLEGALVALALATAFWGPAVVVSGVGDAGELARDLGAWALAVVAALLPATVLSLLWRRLAAVWAWTALLVAGAAAIAGAIVVPSYVAG